MGLFGNEVGAVFLQPEFQGRKIGGMMMDKAQDLHGNLELEVFEKNSIGRQFYLKYSLESIEEKIHKPTGESVLRLKFFSAENQVKDQN